MPGIVLIEEEVWYIRAGSEGHSVGTVTKPLELFLSTMNSPKLQGKNTYWRRVKYQHPETLRICVPSKNGFPDELSSYQGGNLDLGDDEGLYKMSYVKNLLIADYIQTHR